MESIQISTTMNLFREEVGKNDPEYIAASQLHVSKSEEEKKLLRKSDAVVLPLAALCYLVAYLVYHTIAPPLFPSDDEYRTATALEMHGSWASRRISK